MTEIQLRIDELTKSINNMQNLKSVCSNINMKAPDTQGGGETVNEIEHIVAVYKDIHKQLEVLLNNTIGFLSATKSAFEAADKQAASQIKK